MITISKNMKGLNHLIVGVGTNQSTGAATLTATDTYGNTYQTDRVHDHSTQSNNVFLLSCLPTTKLLIGDTITSMCPYNDDILIFFGDHTIYMMRGDPLANGQIDLDIRLQR